ncbi:MAG: AAA family ATPase [Muribaculaceae bacterium]|nr:AAA family ATPase [Muribaculaceae bacterium]
MDSNTSPANLTDSAKCIINETSVNLFLTGKAGTGKTTFLHSLSATTPKRHVVLAPTGVAAINAGGSTLHSFFQLSFAPYIPGKGYAGGEREKIHRFSKEKLNIIRTLDLIIIDEISMVRPDVLDAIDNLLRSLRNPVRPFGGVQLLLIGDLRQLAPVAQDSEWQHLRPYYASPYFFESHALKQAGFLMVELTKVYRQSDAAFVDILNRIRDNRADHDTLLRLNRRADPALLQRADREGHIRLTTHNYQANRTNMQQLQTLAGTPELYEAEISGEFPESAYPADVRLALKVGAKVMFIKNDASGAHEYYNGLIGTVLSLSADTVVVRTPDEDSDLGYRDIKTGKVIWERMKYSLDKDGNIVETPEGTFCQIPLRLAWAITIHKSQGLTFDKAVVDASHSFAPGQTYVALSRCRSLDGLVLESPLPASAIITDPAVNDFISSQPRMEGSVEELSSFRESYYAEMLAELFDFRSLDKAFDDYHRAVASVLARDFPKMAASVGEAYHDFGIKVMDVASRLFALFARTVPLRSDPVRGKLLAEKISGGAAYFVKYLDAFADMVKLTPLNNVDNQAFRKRLTTATGALSDLLELKARLLDAYREKDFDPQDYLKQKTSILLRNRNANGSGSKERAPRKRDGAAPAPMASDITNPALFEKLKAWRTERAEGKAAYTVLPNRSLMAIADILPRSEKDLHFIPGMGKVKIDMYGDEVLAIVKDYIEKADSK